jgi:hypothetical protein
VCIRHRDFYIGHDLILLLLLLLLLLYLCPFFVHGHVPISLENLFAAWPNKFQVRKASSPRDDVQPNEVHHTSKTAVMDDTGAMVK